jgi:hypothetical protein
MSTNVEQQLITVSRLLLQAVPDAPPIRVEATGSPEWARVSHSGEARWNNVILAHLQELYVAEQDPDNLYTFYVKIDH